MERVHELPRFFFAPHLDPAGHVEETRPGRRRVRHNDMPLVDRLRQVSPGRRLRQIVFLAFRRVEAD